VGKGSKQGVNNWEDGDDRSMVESRRRKLFGLGDQGQDRISGIS